MHIIMEYADGGDLYQVRSKFFLKTSPSVDDLVAKIKRAIFRRA